VDDDTRQAFASMMAAVSTVDANVRASSAVAAENAREFRAGLAAINVRVDEVVGDVKNIKRHVFGSDPPPAAGGAIMRQVSEHESELATLAGQVIAVSSKADKVITMQEEQNKVLAKQNEVLADQNAMLATITKSVGGFLGHPIVRKVALAVGLAILAYFNRGVVGLQ
jgi:hypothetical protein